MKISYAQVFQAAPSLNVLANRPFSAAVAIKLVDIIDMLNPHLIAIERFRDSLQSDGEEKSPDELSQQFAEYLNTTTADLGSFVPLLPEEADAAGLAFTVREMASVRFMFAAPLPSRPNSN
jgi:hypothetical protein